MQHLLEKNMQRRLFLTIFFCWLGIGSTHVAYGQPVDDKTGFLLRLDLTQDGLINNHDLLVFQASLREPGFLGRGTSIPVNSQIAHLDFDLSQTVNLLDAVQILNNFGHFEQDGSFTFLAPNGCQLGDFNADSIVDEADMDEFRKGYAFWQWWNLNFPPAPALYTFGDLDMNGIIDETDFGYIRLFWSAGVEDFDNTQTMPNSYTSQEPPSTDCFPIGWRFWLGFI